MAANKSVKQNYGGDPKQMGKLKGKKAVAPRGKVAPQSAVGNLNSLKAQPKQPVVGMVEKGKVTRQPVVGKVDKGGSKNQPIVGVVSGGGGKKDNSIGALNRRKG